MRLQDKVCVVVGGGQTPGETMGNGRAAAIRFAQEGAVVVVVDRDGESADETLAQLPEGSTARSLIADVTDEDDCQRLVRDTVAAYGRIDVLHYNVGKSEGDTEVSELDVEDWDAIMSLNLRGLYLCSKHVLPFMRDQEGGVITAISSAAALASGRNMTYKASKAGMNALVQSMAIDNAKFGVRVNAIMPGLMDTPMAIERRAREQNRSRDSVRRARDMQVPLRGMMGTAWDVANAALFLASDEARFITGIALPVDGGSTARVG